jgi:hypothetical protein
MASYFNELGARSEAAEMSARGTYSDTGNTWLPSEPVSEPTPTPTGVDERIQSILDSENYFKCLGLPMPELDALDRVIWKVDEREIQRSFRKLSVRCHPDKNPSEEAAKAFEKLTKARDALVDEASRTDLVQAEVAELRFKSKHSWQSNGDAVSQSLAAKQRREDAKKM